MEFGVTLTFSASVIEALQDQGSVAKREVAVRTLVQLVQATGSSI